MFHSCNLQIIIIGKPLSPAVPSSLAKCLCVLPECYPRVEHVKGASFGEVAALVETIRQLWEVLPGTNDLD